MLWREDEFKTVGRLRKKSARLLRNMRTMIIQNHSYGHVLRIALVEHFQVVNEFHAAMTVSYHPMDLAG
jgi:hypothetical protein